MAWEAVIIESGDAWVGRLLERLGGTLGVTFGSAQQFQKTRIHDGTWSWKVILDVPVSRGVQLAPLRVRKCRPGGTPVVPRIRDQC